jgi:hypothetical protein
MTDFADRGDGIDWARRIMLRLSRGDTVSRYSEAMAREVLGLELPKPASADVLKRAAQRGSKTFRG